VTLSAHHLGHQCTGAQTRNHAAHTAQARRLAPHPGIAYPLIRDAPLARFALVWRTAAETDLIRTVASVVTELGPIVL
jgi:hypothetical protein